MRSKRRFTLIELLVVIAVISMLLALSASALGSAKLKAKQMMCESNIRQVAQAGTVYSMDYNDNFLSLWDNVKGNNQADNWVYYKDFPNKGEGSYKPESGTLFPYVRSKNVFGCPMQQVKQGVDFAANSCLAESVATSSSSNIGYHAGLKLVKVVSPSRTFMFLEEGANANGSTDDAYFNAMGNNLASRHLSKGICAMVDTHVERLYSFEVYYMTEYPSVNDRPANHFETTF
jgi:prepilin-type N-terminal cleavage/methylation domain-containing protein